MREVVVFLFVLCLVGLCVCFFALHERIFGFIDALLDAVLLHLISNLPPPVSLLRNYNAMMISAPGASEVAQRSEGMKETVLATVLSRSL